MYGNPKGSVYAKKQFSFVSFNELLMFSDLERKGNVTYATYFSVLVNLLSVVKYCCYMYMSASLLKLLGRKIVD